MSANLTELGLQHNANYEGLGVEVEYEGRGWFKLIKTSLKMLFYEDEEGKTRRMSMAKLANVRGIEGVEPVDESKKEPEVYPLTLGLFSNTNYAGKGIEVKHAKDNTWYPLVETSNQILYIDKGGVSSRRMTLKMLSEVRGLEQDVAEGTDESKIAQDTPEPGLFDETFMDTDFAGPMQEDLAEAI